MMFFWLAASLILLIALALLVYPLLNQSRRDEHGDASLETALASRLDELKAESDVGLINEELYEEAQAETRVAFAAEQAPVPPSYAGRRHWLFAGILVAVVAFGSAFIYLNYSNGYQYMLAMEEADKAIGELLDLIDELEEELAENPESYKNWRLLARTRKDLQQYDAAASAYQQLERLGHLDGLEDWHDYAESLVFSNQSPDKAREMLNRILQLNAEDYAALYLYGLLEFGEDNFAAATERWETLYQLMEGADPHWRNEVRTMIAEAQQLSERQSEAIPETAAETETPPLLTVSVAVAAELKDGVDSTDTLFVSIKAIGGPPMPIAVKRLTPEDIGQTITFTDADAMMPSLLPSMFEQLEVTARLSKSGQAQRQAGDLIGVGEAVVQQQAPAVADIVIDQIVE